MKYRLLILFLLLGSTRAAEILILSSIASISHSRWFGILANLLANHNHKVVVLDTDPNFFEHPNITHILMPGGYAWLNEIEKQVKTDPAGLDSVAEASSIIDMMNLVTDPSFLSCDFLLETPETKKFMEEYRGHKFDVIIADGFCESFYGFVPYFGNPPLIPTSPYMDIVAGDFIGLFNNPSYVPFHFASFSSKMSFDERLINTGYTVLYHFMTHFYGIPNNDRLIKRIFGPSTPSLASILKNNVPVVMTGYSHAVQGAIPSPPGYITIPGFHAEHSQPLPKNIKTFLDGAKNGAILFSMGSNFKSILMSKEKREMFISIFKDLPQRVIWKLELDDTSNIPSNIMITKWLPQNDILRHPNVKAFISHGGLLGTQEAVYHGVPVLGLPLMFDQINNLEKLEQHGAAIRLFYGQLNRKDLAIKIDKILNDPSYRHNMKELSAAFRDSPQTSQERALFWIEYVIRNSANNNRFIRSASADLDIAQRILLDVVGFCVVCLVVLYLIIATVLKIVYNLICGSNRNTSNQKKKTQ